MKKLYNEKKVYLIGPYSAVGGVNIHIMSYQNYFMIILILDL